MANEDLDGSPPQEQLEELLPQRSTEQIMAEMAAENPQKHGITLAQRLAQMTALLKRDHEPDDYQRVYELRVEQIGGDPDEMLLGNKPRYTMDEETLAVKDHETGEIYSVEKDEGKVIVAVEPDSQLAKDLQTNYPETSFEFNTKDYGLIGISAINECDHTWPDPVEAETPCSKCSLKFGEWAAS